MPARSARTPARRPGRRRLLAGVGAGLALITLAGCTGSSSAGGGAKTGGSTPSDVVGPLTVGGADFTEMRIMEALYGQLLAKAGFKVTYRTAATREAYEPELEAGTIDVVPEYAATFAEYLNGEQNGAQAKLVASPDVAATVTALRTLAQERGLSVLAAAKAANQNGFAVSAAFAKKRKVTTLSQLAALKEPVALAATAECARRPFCQVGLERVYGINISSILPLGFGTAASKQAVLDDEAVLALVGTTDGTLAPLKLRLLADDKKLQLADNLVPVVNAESAGGAKVAAALDPLAGVLTTADLARLNEQVDGERRTPAGVATDYLKAKKLI